MKFWFINLRTLKLQDKDISILQCNIIQIYMDSMKYSITLFDFQLTTYHMSVQSRSLGVKSVLWYILFHKIWSAASTCLISKLFQHVSQNVRFSAHLKRRFKWGLLSVVPPYFVNTVTYFTSSPWTTNFNQICTKNFDGKGIPNC